MEYWTNATTGLTTVSLGGVVRTNCTRDVDCPGRAICMLNATWLSADAMCICPPEYDLTGSFCESTTIYGKVFAGLQIISTVIAMMGFLIGVECFVSMRRAGLVACDVVSTSVSFSVISLGLCSIQTASSLRFIFEWRQVTEAGQKIDSSQIGSITAAGVFVFSILCMLNISLAWIEMAENASKLSLKAVSLKVNIRRFRQMLIFLYVFIVALMAVALGLREFIVTASVTLPAILIIIVTYAIGYRRMNIMLSDYASAKGLETDEIGGSSGKSAVLKIQQSLLTIKIASIVISVASFGYIIWLGAWIALGGFADRPGQGMSLVALACAWMCSAIGNAAVVTYLRIVIKRRAQSPKVVRGRTVTNTNDRVVDKVDIHMFGSDLVPAYTKDNGSRFASVVVPNDTEDIEEKGASDDQIQELSTKDHS